ncbi:homoserine dehydrogenase [Halomonas sp. BC04]|nr:homoserine dehydrogenase [Halomonas sp. BC04]
MGICGLGTVGGGTFNVLTRNADEIARRAGRPIVIEQVAHRSLNPECDLTGIKTTTDVFEVARNPDIDVVVELVGGYELARELVLTAIANGKHVVTANKALIAVHGNEIFQAAHEQGVIVAFEGAVAGGVPVIKSLREGLGANRIEWVAGIINGTGNYILTHMRSEGRAFEDVLAEAQALGYAEADPTFDVEGIDAAHKLTILASIAFGVPLQFEKAYTEGISRVTFDDVEQADNLGYTIKHLGICKRTDEGLELRVHPTLIPKERLLANVHGVKNAIAIMGDAVGPTLYYGAGAGAEPPHRRWSPTCWTLPGISPPTTTTGCPTWPSSALVTTTAACRSCPWRISSPPTTCACWRSTVPAYWHGWRPSSPSRGSPSRRWCRRRPPKGNWCRSFC